MIGRRVLGTLAGVVASTGTIMVLELVGHQALGVPADPSKASLPLAFVLVAWTSGALVGGLVGSRLARWTGAAWIVALLIVAGVIATTFAIAHPWWMTAAGVTLPLLAAALITRRLRPTAAQRVAL